MNTTRLYIEWRVYETGLDQASVYLVRCWWRRSECPVSYETGLDQALVYLVGCCWIYIYIYIYNILNAQHTTTGAHLSIMEMIYTKCCYCCVLVVVSVTLEYMACVCSWVRPVKHSPQLPSRSSAWSCPTQWTRTMRLVDVGSNLTRMAQKVPGFRYFLTG
jgi:hypothetical protein